MSGRSILSPSKAERWIACPGSIALCEGIPDSTSKYAEEGTRAHEYAAWLLNGAKLPMPFEPEQKMVGYVSTYTNAVRQAAEGKVLLVEQLVPLEAYTTELGGKGTADAIIINPETNFIEVHDLKYGEGVLVGAENNAQLMLYALGAVSLAEQFLTGMVSHVRLVIHQPRRDRISETTITRLELLTFGLAAHKAGKLALSSKKGEHLHPSEKACLWCPAKSVCPALEESVHKAVFDQFGETRAQALPTADTLALIETWLKAIRDRIYSELQDGLDVPGWKLVEGRQGNRAWSDPIAVAAQLAALHVKKSDSHETTLKSPAQMEKAISKKKWAAVANLTSRSDAKHVAVAESDEREAIKLTMKDDFDNVDVTDFL